MPGPFIVAPSVANATASYAGRNVVFEIGKKVVLTVALDKAEDMLSDLVASGSASGWVSNVLDEIPANMREGKSDEELGQAIANWMIDVANAAVNRGAAELADAFNGELVLNFGNRSFNAQEKVERPRYDFDGATAALLRNDDEKQWESVATPIRLESNDGGVTDFHFDTGLTVIIAGSGVGKTTLCRNFARYLVDQDGEYNPKVSYLSWSEREYYSAGGTLSNFVELVEDATDSSDVLMIDSLREFTIGGAGSAGYRGMNTEFFVQLTQWHHAFKERNVCGLVIVNPIIKDSDFVEILEEIIRGSTNGFLHITKRGQGRYEHVRTGRSAVQVRIPVDGWVDKVMDPIESPTTVEISTPTVAVDEFQDSQTYFR